MESEVAAAEKAAAQARREAEEAAALIQDDVRREVSILRCSEELPLAARYALKPSPS